MVRVAPSIRAVLLVCGVLVWTSQLWAVAAQDRPGTNPAQPDPASIRAGAALFGTRGCADCHGADAKGAVGPDLTRLWTSGGSSERVFQTIRRGVPGSVMPASSAPDQELHAIVAYLESLGRAAAGEGASGDASRGQQLFWSNCGECHRVNERGGRLGPDLSRVAATLNRQQLVRAIREPDASIAAGYRGVTLTTKSGQRIQGVKKGEDAFSLQILDTRERLQGYAKADLRTVVNDEHSLMPAFGADRLSDRDLEDVLRFLSSLRGAASNHP